MLSSRNTKHGQYEQHNATRSIKNQSKTTHNIFLDVQLNHNWWEMIFSILKSFNWRCSFKHIFHWKKVKKILNSISHHWVNLYGLWINELDLLFIIVDEAKLISMWRARHLRPWSFIMIIVSHLIDRL